MNDFLAKLETDDALFHYTTMSALLMHIGWTKQLKFGRRLNSRNPDEYRNWNYYAVGFDPPGVDVNTMMQAFFSVNKQINKCVQNDFRIACFTINDFICDTDGEPTEVRRLGYMRPRMWSQYADDHSGVCLVFSKSKLLKKIAEQFPSIICYSKSITYSDDEEHDRFPQVMEPHKMTEATYFKKYIAEHMDEIFFTKEIDFRDEAEFRVILQYENEDSLFLNIDNSLEGILVGDRASTDLNQELWQLTDTMGCSIKKLQWENGKYKAWELSGIT